MATFSAIYLIVTLFVNFKHNFHKENETFSPKKLKRFKEKSLKMEPFLSELPYHIYDWLIISLNDFCIVIRNGQLSCHLSWTLPWKIEKQKKILSDFRPPPPLRIPGHATGDRALSTEMEYFEQV